MLMSISGRPNVGTKWVSADDLVSQTEPPCFHGIAWRYKSKKKITHSDVSNPT